MLWTVASSSHNAGFVFFWKKHQALQSWLTCASFDLAVAGISRVLIVLVGGTGR